MLTFTLPSEMEYLPGSAYATLSGTFTPTGNLVTWTGSPGAASEVNIRPGSWMPSPATRRSGRECEASMRVGCGLDPKCHTGVLNGQSVYLPLILRQ